MIKKIQNQIKKNEQLKEDRQLDLSHYSHARVGLGHTGGHLRLKDWLSFEAGFAKAKDAVFSTFNTLNIVNLCAQEHLVSLEIDSSIHDATEFLLRPDLGRLISESDQQTLSQYINQHKDYCEKDLLIVISGGLSPEAIETQIPFFLPLFIKETRKFNWSLAPIIINPKGRVALGDHLNEYFKAKIVVMLIGERPGLTTPDSLGIYFTYQAKRGCTDEERNCISNIHPDGLPYEEAANKLAALLNKALLKKMTGIELKDEDIQLGHE